jgi:hypothetical protein
MKMRTGLMVPPSVAVTETKSAPEIVVGSQVALSSSGVTVGRLGIVGGVATGGVVMVGGATAGVDGCGAAVWAVPPECVVAAAPAGGEAVAVAVGVGVGEAMCVTARVVPPAADAAAVVAEA